MTKRELIEALRDVPDDAQIMQATDWGYEAVEAIERGFTQLSGDGVYGFETKEEGRCNTPAVMIR